MALPPPVAFPAVPFDNPVVIANAVRSSEEKPIYVDVVDEDGSVSTEVVYLAEDTSDPEQCYQRWPKPPTEDDTISLGGKGRVLFCRILKRHRIENDDRLLFKRTEDSVAIKKLRREKFDPDLERERQGTGPVVNENPYEEIKVMRRYGDDEHIVRCVDALWDEKYLYIVTRHCFGKALHFKIRRELGGGYLHRQQIPTVVRQLVRNLECLQRHNLVHRDLKPDNILHDWPLMPMIDFAMTRRVAVIEGRPQLLLNPKPGGSPTYISPEVILQQPFGFPVDVWALGCIVWELLTGGSLYEKFPLATDLSFRVFIRMDGFANEVLCDVLMEILQQYNVPEADKNKLYPRLQAVQSLSQVERDFLRLLLRENPNERPSLQEILAHDYLR